MEFFINLFLYFFFNLNKYKKGIKKINVLINKLRLVKKLIIRNIFDNINSPKIYLKVVWQSFGL